MRSITIGMRKRQERALRHRSAEGDGRVRQPVLRMLAPNLDRLVLVGSFVSPELRPGLIDRLLVLAELECVSAVVVLNKVDLLDSREPAEHYQRLYRSLGYGVVLTSTRTGEGVERLRGLLSGRSALCGHSGVGKSSLLSALEPTLQAETQEVSLATGKGQHTTTAVRLYRLPWGELFDLPGLKLVPLQVQPHELGRLFPDFAACRCRFGDCLHQGEPGCAVSRAVDDGLVDSGRYASYLRMLQSPG